MKKLLVSINVAALVATLVIGCKSAHQTAYKTLYSVQQVTVGAFDGYLAQVVKRDIPDTSLPQVSKKFNKFQVSFLVALDAVQYNTNALAPSSLIVESQDVINLIKTFTTK